MFTLYGLLFGSFNVLINNSVWHVNGMEYCFGYVTAPDLEEATKISNSLLEKKWIACANFFPMQSMYVWEGKIEKAQEVVMIIKTEKKFQSQIQNWIEKNHSYDTPCVVWLPILSGSEKYLEWISSSLKS